MAITAVAGAAAGSGAPGPVVQTGSRDDSLVVFVGTGTSTTTGQLVVITLAGNYSSTTVDEPAIPKVVAGFGCPSTAWAASLPYISAVTTRTVTISVQVAPPASQAASSAQGLGVILHIAF